MPRFGFAYRPFGNDKWAIRGGVGIYNINMLGSSFYSLTGTVQAYTQQFTNTYNSDDPRHRLSVACRSIRVPAATAAPLAMARDYFGTANSTNWKDPYTEQWSLERGSRFRLRVMRRASPISARRRINWCGRRTKTRCRYSTTVSAFNAPISSPPVSQLGPHQHARYRRQRELPLAATGSQPPPATRARISLRLHLGQGPGRQPGPLRSGNGTASAAKAAASASTSILDRHVDFGNVYGTRRLRWNTTALYDLPFGRGKHVGRRHAARRRPDRRRLALVLHPHRADRPVRDALLPRAARAIHPAPAPA